MTDIIEKKKDQQMLSEEMQEFISNKPHWVVRHGNTILLLILVGLISISWLIEYPDIINAPMRIVAVNAPKLLIARKEGKLERLLVLNDQQVQEGQPLAYLQSTADHRQILNLYHWIEAIEPFSLKDSLEILLHVPVPSTNDLGEVQAAYQDFETSLLETLQILASGFYQEKKKALQQDILYMKEAKESILKQKKLTLNDLELQETEYTVKESLAKDRVIAPLEFNQDKSRLISKQQSIEQLNAQIIANKISAYSKRKEIMDLQKLIMDQKHGFHSALLKLKSELQNWMNQYIVTATTSGRVNFVGFLQENQYLQNNQELFYIIPSSNKFYGELKATQSGIGKIAEGQKVMIRVKSFPSAEFGYLTGVVEYIPTLVESDGGVLIKVAFVNGLKTNYGKTLIFKSNMDAVAEVVTYNRRLPERLVGQLRQALTR